MWKFMFVCFICVLIVVSVVSRLFGGCVLFMIVGWFVCVMFVFL